MPIGIASQVNRQKSKKRFNNNLTFNYTGSLQSWTVPSGVNSISINAIGGKGGDCDWGTPGGGANVTSTISVTPGQTLYIVVGKAGNNSNLRTPGTSCYGGGGSGGGASAAFPGNRAGAGGGGYSGIFSSSSINTTNALVIAAGGGGAVAGGNVEMEDRQMEVRAVQIEFGVLPYQVVEYLQME